MQQVAFLTQHDGPIYINQIYNFEISRCHSLYFLDGLRMNRVTWFVNGAGPTDLCFVFEIPIRRQHGQYSSVWCRQMVDTLDHFGIVVVVFVIGCVFHHCGYQSEMKW